MRAPTLRQIRPFVQLAAFLLFLYLTIWVGRTGVVPADLFYRLDPLAGLSAMLAGRQILPAMLIGGAVTLLATLLLGRAWCGWLCPMGTVLDWTPAHRSRPKEPDLQPRWRQVKYFLLTLVISSAALGSLSCAFLDPITLLYRSLASAVWPAFNAVLWAGERAAYAVPFLQGPIDALEASARGVILPAQPPLYGGGVLVGLVFVGVLALNAVRSRFWCRYLCPLGGLLGLVSKVAWLRRTVGQTCTECQRCARACPTGTIDPARGFASDPAECTMCLDCVPACSRTGQHFRGHLQPAAWQRYDPSRRHFLAAAGAAVAATGLFAIEPAAMRGHPWQIRPPGAQGRDFLSKCIRCGICVKVCPTGGLQPSLGESGWGGLWSPVLAPRLGQCDFSCNACGQVCPTQAIPRLTLEEKRVTVMGHAYIDRDRCIPWADNRICLVCEEMCPLPDKAIQLEDVTVTLLDGSEAAVRRPYVLHDRCIGCGHCENRCPLAGESAIRVYAPTDWDTVPVPLG